MDEWQGRKSKGVVLDGAGGTTQNQLGDKEPLEVQLDEGTKGHVTGLEGEAFRDEPPLSGTHAAGDVEQVEFPSQKGVDNSALKARSGDGVEEGKEASHAGADKSLLGVSTGGDVEGDKGSPDVVTGLLVQARLAQASSLQHVGQWEEALTAVEAAAVVDPRVKEFYLRPLLEEVAKRFPGKGS